jgi:hypothetical protein
MPFRNDEEMNWCMRPNIFDHHHGFIFIYEIGGSLFPDNHAQSTILFHESHRFAEDTERYLI